MHFGHQRVADALANDRPPAPSVTREATLFLEPGDTAWNPASAMDLLEGPGQWLYSQHPDGGISVERIA